MTRDGRRRKGRGGAPPRLAASIAASRHFLPAVLFVACLGAYVSNGGFLPGSDQEGSMLFSVNLLKRHSFSLGPPDAPHAFFWTLEQAGTAPRPVAIETWNGAADAAYVEGRLKAPEHHYYVAATTRPDVYVNTFGIGAPLLGLPAYAVIDLFVDLAADRSWWWRGGALTASLLTALAAVFVFLAARAFVKPLPALLTALAFGLGSCVWPVSSQALWQHPASTFCLSLGALFLVRSAERPHAAAWCGAALGMAVLCRPTAAVAVVCAGAYLLWADRRRCAVYVLGGLPFLLILIAYNHHYFGSPFVFGQTAASKLIFLRDTGSDSLWQSSWLESLPGLFISPSRGLLWFSPVLLLGLFGAAAVWRQRRYRVLIPVQVTVVLMILVAGRWTDWSGGLTWGYRSIVDATPFLALLMAPVMQRVIAGRGTRVLLAALLAWSVGAQFVGAWSYSVIGWHTMTLEYDDPNHASVWLWRRPQIAWHLANFAAERAQKKRLMAAYADDPRPVLVLPERTRDAADAGRPRIVELSGGPAALHNAAEELRGQGRYEEAVASFRAALEIDPHHALSHAGMGVALFRLQRYEEALQALERAVSLDLDAAVEGPLRRLMGRAAQELGRFEAAAEHYGRALAIDPRDAEAIDRLAVLQFGRQRYADALDLYRTLVEIDPANAPAHANLGVALYHLGRTEEAIRSFEHALALDPDLEAAQVGLAALRDPDGRTDDEAAAPASD